MSFPRYPEYKDSGVEWLGKVPAHWEFRRTKFLFDLKKRPPRADDEIVTAFRDGEVTLRSNRRLDGFTNALQEIGYQGVRKGDLVIHAMDAFAGAIGVSDSDGKSTPVYSVCQPRNSVDAWYYGRLLRHMALSGFINALAKGIRERSTEFRWAEAGNVRLPLPPLGEQVAIVTFLDRETAKIDALVAELERLTDLLAEKITSLVLSSIKAPETQELRLEDAAILVSRPVHQREDEIYTPIGIFNRGRGLFHKEPREMAEMGDSDFFWLERGDLILSGQFAWEGAVALAGEAERGCVVSHRYPVLRGKSGVALTEYLLALFLTKHGDFLLNENSRGAAGRNRPLNINSLLKEKIPIVDMRIQERVARTVHARNEVLAEIVQQVELLKERRSALISAAVTGKIDVRSIASQPAQGLQELVGTPA